MQLDLITLCVVSVYVAALVGALLLFSWWQNRGVKPLAWWGTSLVLAAGSTILVIQRGVWPDWMSIGAANAILFIAYGLFWGGFRAFERRTVPLGFVFAGGLLWLAACGIPDFYRSFPTRVLLASLIPNAYCFAAGLEIWRGRGETLVSRYPIIVLLIVHSAFLAVRYPTLIMSGHASELTVFTMPWVVTHSFESLLFTIASPFLMLAMVKERTEREQRAIAACDPLTGILNRRAFQSLARERLEADRRVGRPASLLVVDLDHFKDVNDRFGHAIGDEVLRGFCGCAQTLAAPDTLLARLGGEEFALLLPGSDRHRALRFANRVRDNFAQARFLADTATFSATVSIGVATSDDVGHLLDALTAAADLALYQAKRAGRNRVRSVSQLAEVEPLAA